MTEGLTEKKYHKIISQVLNNLPDLNEWLNIDVLKKFKYISWKESLKQLHNPKNLKKKGPFLERLIFDEILSTFLINSRIRKAVKKIKKIRKNFDSQALNFIKKKNKI